MLLAKPWYSSNNAFAVTYGWRSPKTGRHVTVIDFSWIYILLKTCAHSQAEKRNNNAPTILHPFISLSSKLKLQHHLGLDQFTIDLN